MQRIHLLAALSLGVFLTGGAVRAEPASAQGVSWRSQGEAAQKAPAHGEAGLVAECRRVVKAVGPVAKFESHGRQLSAAGLKSCNRAVRPYETAAR